MTAGSCSSSARRAAASRRRAHTPASNTYTTYSISWHQPRLHAATTSRVSNPNPNPNPNPLTLTLTAIPNPKANPNPNLNDNPNPDPNPNPHLPGYRRAPTASSSSSRTPAAPWRWCAREGITGPTSTSPSQCEAWTASSCHSPRRAASPSRRSRSASRRGAAACVTTLRPPAPRSQLPMRPPNALGSHPSCSGLPSELERRAWPA